MLAVVSPRQMGLRVSLGKDSWFDNECFAMKAVKIVNVSLHILE